MRFQIWKLFGLREARFELVDDGVNAGWPRAVGIAAIGFGPDEVAGACGAGVDFELEDGLVGGADVDAVLAGGNDDKGEVAGVIWRRDGFAEAFGEFGELSAGEAVNLSVFDRNDVRGAQRVAEGEPVARGDAFEDAAAGGGGGRGLLRASRDAEDAS